jgi:hypothetical protein
MEPGQPTAVALTVPRPWRVIPVAGVLLLIAASGAAAEPGERPTAALLRLVPPDAAVVVSVDGLRDQARAFLASKLAADLGKLPAVKAWLASDKFQQFERSHAQIERALGANLNAVRDELLGDAVVLALRLPADPAADPSLGGGMLLVQVRDYALLKRLISFVNTAQQESGELTRVIDRQRGGTTYHLRELPPAAGRLPEWYVDYPDGTFAFSNSESLIQAVIDRKVPAGAVASLPGPGPRIEPGLGDQPRFKKVENRLPARGVVRLFVDPRHFEWAFTRAPGSKPSDIRVKEMLERYVAAADYAGANLEWSDAGIVVSAVETLNPSRLDAWLRRWATDGRPVDPKLTRVPPTTMALASGRLDAVSLFDGLVLLVAEADQSKLANFETLLTGLLLGQDVRSRVLPQLGPGIVAYVDSAADRGQGAPGAGALPGGRWPFPAVIAVSVSGDSGTSSTASVLDALDNALRTVLAMSALDEKRAQGRGRITTQQVAGVTVMTLDPPVPFAYAIDRANHRVVLGTKAAAVARYLESSADPAAGQFFRTLQATAFAGAQAYACVNLDAFSEWAGKHRDRLASALATRQNRPIADVESDLAQVLALAQLFQAGFVTSRIDADLTAVHHSIGLVRDDLGRK